MTSAAHVKICSLCNDSPAPYDTCCNIVMHAQLYINMFSRKITRKIGGKSVENSSTKSLQSNFTTQSYHRYIIINSLLSILLLHSFIIDYLIAEISLHFFLAALLYIVSKRWRKRGRSEKIRLGYIFICLYKQPKRFKK